MFSVAKERDQRHEMVNIVRLYPGDLYHLYEKPL